MQYNGLNDEEVIESRKKYGTNSITKRKKDTFLKLLLESLSDPIIKILLIALFIKLLFLFKNSDIYETIGIFVAIFIASLISTLSEYGSEKTFEAMESINSVELVKVIRNKNIISIPIEEIVMGDYVILESGDKIPSDGIILSGSISVDESSLTGESIEKEKNIDDNIYKGTNVYTGKCIYKTTNIGDNTYYGKICGKK